MGYCRFSNTLSDLQDCYDHMSDSDEDLSEPEIKNKAKLIKLCKEIAEAYLDDDEE